MSLHPNWAALASVELPWKTFVRGSKNTPVKLANTFSSSLNFKGNEAKAAYEDVINTEYNNGFSRKRNEVVESNESQKTCGRDSGCNNLKTSRSKEANIVRNISVNSILKAVEQDDVEFLRKHLNSDNVNESDDFGWTPLMSAAYGNNVKIVELLLQLGANKKAREKSGLTAAQLALKRNYLTIVALLRKRNLHHDTKTEGESALSRSNTEDNQVIEEVIPSKSGATLPGNESENRRVSLEDSNSGFYCNICNASFRESSVKKHESSTLHVFNTKPKLPTAIYGISKQNKGYQMLLNTGWDEEGGLGPLGDGSKYPIKTILKRDRKGLGQNGQKDARVTHFKPGDTSAVNSARVPRQKTLKKRDREKLLSREARKERALRIALS